LKDSPNEDLLNTLLREEVPGIAGIKRESSTEYFIHGSSYTTVYEEMYPNRQSMGDFF
jgi:hypothetical protein